MKRKAIVPCDHNDQLLRLQLQVSKSIRDAACKTKECPAFELFLLTSVSFSSDTIRAAGAKYLTSIVSLPCHV